MTQTDQPDYGVMENYRRPSWINQLRITKQMASIMILLKSKFMQRRYTIVDVFLEAYHLYPNSPCMIFEGKEYTYKEVEEGSNRVAHAMHTVGVKQGDVVALLMDNRPEYVMTWLAMAKIGAVSALINSSVKGSGLYGMMEVSTAQYIIIGDECKHLVAEPTEALQDKKWFCWGGSAPNMTDLDPLVDAASPATVDPALRDTCGFDSQVVYIYTSGTTGLPKAAKIRSWRMFGAGTAMMQLAGFGHEDRVYCCLPLCHSSATLLGVCGTWRAGAALILRRKFSASNYFSDCKRHGATVAMYIGEICRFLTLKPDHEDDRAHKLRVCVGNGLRPDVWKTFVDRFNIPNICEFYASTEGNVMTINTMNKIGAVGYLPPLLRLAYPMKIVKFDYETEMPVRDKNGHCIICDKNEPGEGIAVMSQKSPWLRFDGYTNKAATDKKILRNVFKDGDAYFRSGDIIRMDEDGFLYFCDRVGDTFRWKGENVATTEVSHVIDSTGVLSSPANVYGIEIPGYDGRAGMAAISPSNSLSVDDVLAQVYTATDENLAPFQKPLFLRLVKEMDVTGTSKLKKTDLVKEGADPSKVAEPLYFRDPREKKYLQLTTELYEEILDPNKKLI